MSNQTKARRLVAIMFTDIVGYTALMQENEERAAEVRNRHRQVFDQLHQQYHGEILQYFGDGTLSVFPSCVEAVTCAVVMQRSLQTGPEKVPLRIGLHLGDIVFDGTEVYGDGVNLASRIESMGMPGAILLSGNLQNELKNHPELSTRSLGKFELKNIADPVEVFCITNEGIVVPEPTALKGKLKEDQLTIAVLPFVNMSTSEENEYFTDGMTEEIINALSRIRNLKVTSRTSSFHFKNKQLPIPQIGRELNVSTILEGSIRLAGKKMRISAQLINVADDFHFWSETFDRPVEDVFAVQDEISLLIADKLREHTGHFEIDEHLVDAPDIPVEAYKRFLKSRYLLLKMSKSEIDEGMHILQGVIRDQPGFAEAYLGMHLGYTLKGTIGLMPAGEAFAKGKPYLDKAIFLKPDLPECQLHLAWISFLQHWDLAATYQHLNKALELRPVVDFYQSMASVLVAEGKCDAAMHYIETALQLDPFSEINYHLKGFIYYIQENFEKAIECFEESVRLKSNFSISTLYWGQSLLLLGRNEEALAFFQGIPDDEPGDILKLGGTTLALAALGNETETAAGMDRLKEALQTELLERALNFLILCHTMRGEKDLAIQSIEKGIEYRLPMLVYLYADPLLASLRPDARFQALMHQVLGEGVHFELSPRKYKQALFTDAELSRQKRRLIRQMEKEKPYLDPDLSLRSLAQKTDLPPNHLSQLLNEGFGQNFAEFVNSYRLEAFKQRVADPSLQHLTILGLAYESGFNSKTVFNTFFKRMMGKTPRAYWKEVVEEKK